MRNRIVGSLRSSGDPELTKAAGAVSQNFVFEYPSIRELASAVAAFPHAVEHLVCLKPALVGRRHGARP